MPRISLCGHFQCWYFGLGNGNGRVGKRWIVKLYCHAYLLKYVSHVHSFAPILYINEKSTAVSFKLMKKETKNVGIFSHKNYLTIKKCKRSSQTDWWWETKLHPFNLRSCEGKNARTFTCFICATEREKTLLAYAVCHFIHLDECKIHWFRRSRCNQIRSLPVQLRVQHFKSENFDWKFHSIHTDTYA